MSSGTTFRRLGVAVVATAFTALVGITAAGAATTPGNNPGAATTKPSVCEARADKRKLTGDQRDSYVKRCMAQVNRKHKPTANKASAKAPATQQQPTSTAQ